MKKILVSFYDPSVNSKFSNLPISRQTFSEKGDLSNIIFTLNDLSADWHIVGTWTNNIDEIIGKKIIYMQQEPLEIKYPSSDILDYCEIALTFFKIDHKINQVLAPPALQWTYDISAKLIPGKGHVYSKINNHYLNDFLYAPIPEKKKKCSIIVSSKKMIEGHKLRFNFVEALRNRFKDEIDVFGFGYNPIENKKDAIDPYYYSIAIENTKIKNWWTEKLADVFLGYTCPIYYGCENIFDFFDKGSLLNININEPEEAFNIIKNAINNISY